MQATQLRLVECFGSRRRRALKHAIFDLFRSGKKWIISHYAYTTQLFKGGKEIHWNKSAMQNGNCENRVFSSAINDDRRCRSGRDRRWFGRTASPASTAFNKSRPRRLHRPRHLMSLVLPRSPPKKTNWLMFIVAKRLHGSRCYFVRR